MGSIKDRLNKISPTKQGDEDESLINEYSKLFEPAPQVDPNGPFGKPLPKDDSFTLPKQPFNFPASTEYQNEIPAPEEQSNYANEANKILGRVGQMQPINTAPSLKVEPKPLEKSFQEAEQSISYDRNIDNMVSDIDKRMAYIEKNSKQDATGSFQYKTSTDHNVSYSDIYKLGEAKQLLTNLKKYKNDPGGLISGIKQSDWGNVLTAGLKGTIGAVDMLSIAKKAESGEELNENEQLLLTASSLLNQYQSENPSSFGYSTGQVLTGMIPFMVQLGLTGGAGTVIGKGGEEAAKAGVKAYLKTLPKLLLKQTAYDAPRVLAMPMFQSQVAQNITPDIITGQDGKGIVVPGTGDNVIKGVSKAFATTFGERYFEGFGGMLDHAAYPSIKTLGKTLGLDAMFNPAVKSTFASSINQVRKSIGLNNPLGELFEEDLNGLYAPLVSDDAKFSDTFNLETQGQIILSSAIMGGLFKLTEVPANVRNYSNISKPYNLSVTNLKSTFGEDAQSIIAANSIDDLQERMAANDQISAIANTPEKRAVYLDYFQRKVQYDLLNESVRSNVENEVGPMVNKTTGKIQPIVTQKGQEGFITNTQDGVHSILDPNTGQVSLVKDADIDYDNSGDEIDPEQLINDNTSASLAQEDIVGTTITVDGNEYTVSSVNGEMATLFPVDPEGEVIEKSLAELQAPEPTMVQPGESITPEQALQPTEVQQPVQPQIWSIGKKQFQVQEQEDGSTIIPFEPGKDDTKTILGEVDETQFDVIPITEEIPIPNAPAFAKKKTETVVKGVKIVPKNTPISPLENISTENQANVQVENPAIEPEVTETPISDRLNQLQEEVQTNPVAQEEVVSEPVVDAPENIETQTSRPESDTNGEEITFKTLSGQEKTGRIIEVVNPETGAVKVETPDGTFITTPDQIISNGARQVVEQVEPEIQVSEVQNTITEPEQNILENVVPETSEPIQPDNSKVTFKYLDGTINTGTIINEADGKLRIKGDDGLVYKVNPSAIISSVSSVNPVTELKTEPEAKIEEEIKKETVQNVVAELKQEAKVKPESILREQKKQLIFDLLTAEDILLGSNKDSVRIEEARLRNESTMKPDQIDKYIEDSYEYNLDDLPSDIISKLKDLGIDYRLDRTPGYNSMNEKGVLVIDVFKDGTIEAGNIRAALSAINKYFPMTPKAPASGLDNIANSSAKIDAEKQALNFKSLNDAKIRLDAAKNNLDQANKSGTEGQKKLFKNQYDDALAIYNEASNIDYDVLNYNRNISNDKEFKKLMDARPGGRNLMNDFSITEQNLYELISANKEKLVDINYESVLPIVLKFKLNGKSIDEKIAELTTERDNTRQELVNLKRPKTKWERNNEQRLNEKYNNLTLEIGKYSNNKGAINNAIVSEFKAIGKGPLIKFVNIIEDIIKSNPNDSIDELTSKFMEQGKDINNVPPSLRDYFYEKYGENGAKNPVAASKKLVKEVYDNLNSSIKNADKQTEIAIEESRVNTNPTEAQKESGNYKKGHVSIQGLEITIENPKGSIRSGTDKNGNKWEVELKNTYGYFKGTEGKDKDHVDVFLGNNPLSEKVWVVDQIDPETGKFDEHKVILGAESEEEARQNYFDNYFPGWKGLGAITEMPIEEFKAWVIGNKVEEPIGNIDQIPESGKMVEPAIVETKKNPEIEPKLPGDYLMKTTTKTGSTEPSSDLFTIESFSKFTNNLYDGNVNIDEFKSAFDRLINSKEFILAELKPKTKPQLLEYFNSFGKQRYKNENKDRIINAIWDDEVSTFGIGMVSYSMGETYEGAVKRKVEKTTQEDLNKYAEEVAKRREERKQQLEAYKKAITNPETVEEFKTFVRVNGVDKLSQEQRILYDELVTDKVQAKRKEETEKKAEVSKVELNDTSMEMVESKHTKTGADIFVVKLSDRVSPETYKELNEKAKRLGGYYSSFRGNGAVPGFTFKDKVQAEKFMELKENSVSNIDVIEQKIENKKEARAQKLRDAANKIIESADNDLNRDRLTNTVKRAREAGYADAKANENKRIGKTMLNIAEAIDNGDVKLLDGIKARTHIELLDLLVRASKRAEIEAKSNLSYDERRNLESEPATIDTIEYLKYGFYPKIYGRNLIELIQRTKETPGVKLIANRWEKKTSKLTEHDDYQVTSDNELEELKDMLNSVPNSEKWRNGNIEEVLLRTTRLKAMGIENNSMLRTALREYVQYRGGQVEENKVKKLERAIVGKKVGFDFFPTPQSTAETMVNEADISEGMDVLEPSAGNGNIADAIKEAGVLPDVAEISSELRGILEAKGYNVVANDFLDYNDKKYDRIIMNPPFSNGLDGEHIQHAYDLLKPGGRIVAIVGEGTMYRSDKKAVAFRDWLEQVNGSEEKLEAGTFSDKTLLNTTQANARLVVIDKPNEDVKLSIGEQGESTNKAELQQYYNAIGSGAQVKVVSSIDELIEDYIASGGVNSEFVRSQLELTPKFNGLYISGVNKVYVKDTIQVKDKESLWIHENGIHFGINLFFPNRTSKVKLLTRLYRSLGENKVKFAIPFEYMQYGTATRAEEFLAYKAQTMFNNGEINIDDYYTPDEVDELSESETITDDQIRKLINTFVRTSYNYNENGTGINSQNTELSGGNEDTRNSFERRIRKVSAKPSGRAGTIRGLRESNLPGELLKIPQTESKAFKQWFGKSVIKDESGKPLTYYHATGGDFNTFTPNEKGLIFAGPDPKWVQEGFMPLDKEKETSGSIMPVYVKAENPFDYRNPEHLKMLFGALGDIRQSVKDNIEQGDPFGVENKKVVPVIKELGFDGLYVNEQGQVNIGVFEPNQLKSSIGNKGTFSAENPDILLNKNQIETSEFKKWFEGSRVVDENGNPLVVYHATQSDFDSFSKTSIGKAIDAGTLGSGFYFTSSSENASNYANNLNTNTGKIGSESIMPVYLNILNPYDAAKLFETTGNNKKESKAFTDKLKKKGYDGVVFEWGYGRDALKWFVVYEPTQIKSAIGNNGNFDPNNPDIRFSIPPTPPEDKKPSEPVLPGDQFKPKGKFKPMVSTKLEKVREAIQDRMLSVKKLQETEGLKVNESSDIYKTENLASSRAKNAMDNFNEKLFDPLIETIASIQDKYEFTPEETQQYMMAKHAIERNKWMAEQTGVDKVFAGISNDDAQDIIYKYELKVPYELTSKLWEQINKSTDYTLKKYVEYGLMTKQTYQSIKDRNWNHYVPLRGWELTDEERELDEQYNGPKSGKSLNPIKTAKGRESVADSPLPYIASMAHSIIAIGEKNKIKQATTNLVMNNKDRDDLFYMKKVYRVQSGVDDNGQPTYIETFEKPQATDDAKMLLKKEHEFKKERSKWKQHEVEAFINGEKYVSVFADPGVANAINNEQLGETGQGVTRALQSTIGKATRWLSANFTAKNPAFIPVNAVRDIAYAGISLGISNNLNPAKFVKYVNEAKNTILREFKNKPGTIERTKQLTQYYKEFKENGGETGYVHLQGVNEIKDKLERQIRILNNDGNKFQKSYDYVNQIGIIQSAGKLLDHMAVVSENMSRFATFAYMRDSGKSPKESAYRAKEVTVNFNRKGTMTSALGSVFAFFNASVQGGANAVTMANKHKGKFAAVGGSFMAMGVLNALLASLWDDDDKYKNINDYIKQNNIIIPKGIGSDSYITIPLPQFFRQFFAAGVLAVQTLGKEKTPEQMTGEILSNMFESLSPVNPVGFINKKGETGILDITRPFIPTIATPILDLAMNEDFAGKRIVNTPFTAELDRNMASSQKYPKGTNPVVVNFTDNLYKLFGGDMTTKEKRYYDFEDKEFKKVSMLADINPASAEHIIEYYTGGRGKFFSDMIKLTSEILQSGNKVLAGEEFKDVVKEYNANSFPILNRFHRTLYANPASQRLRSFYDDGDMMKTADRQLETYKKAGEFDKYMEISKNSDLMQQVNLFEAYNKSISYYNDIIKQAEKLGKTDMVKTLKEQRDQTVIQYFKIKTNDTGSK